MAYMRGEITVVCVVVCTNSCPYGCVQVRVWLNEVPDGYTGQTDVCLWGLAKVDGVAVQANVLQRISDVVKVVQVAECVLVHHLNVVTLQQKRTVI